MTQFIEFVLSIHDNISYYSLLKVEWNADIKKIKQSLREINNKIWTGYECRDEFFNKQWTDFNIIRNTLTNKKKRRI